MYTTIWMIQWCSFPTMWYIKVHHQKHKTSVYTVKIMIHEYTLLTTWHHYMNDTHFQLDDTSTYIIKNIIHQCTPLYVHVWYVCVHPHINDVSMYTTNYSNLSVQYICISHHLQNMNTMHWCLHSWRDCLTSFILLHSFPIPVQNLFERVQKR